MRSAFSWCTACGFCVVLVSIAAIALPPTLAWADKDDDEDDAVHDLMEKTHKGKNSPWKKVQTAAGADPVDWVAIAGSLPRLGAMSKALATAKSKEVRESAGGYIDAVNELAMQTTKRDSTKARAAVKSLATSCADCHFKGGPGGKLD